MTIGNRISELRKEYSYSQEYVASQLGVSRQAVSKWEQDKTAPDTYNLIALAELFNVSVEYLATGKKPEAVQQKEEKQKDYSTRKTVGFVLLGVGILTGVLGVCLFAELVYLAAALILAGIFCVALKKNFGIITVWVFTVLLELFLSFLTGIGTAWNFNSHGLNIFTVLFTLLNTVLIVLTVIIIAKIIKRVLRK